MAFTILTALLALGAFGANNDCNQAIASDYRKMAGRDGLIYSRLALLQLISEVGEAFPKGRIVGSQASRITQLPQGALKKAFTQCWCHDWQGNEPASASWKMNF